MLFDGDSEEKADDGPENEENSDVSGDGDLEEIPENDSKIRLPGFFRSLFCRSEAKRRMDYNFTVPCVFSS